MLDPFPRLIDSTMHARKFWINLGRTPKSPWTNLTKNKKLNKLDKLKSHQEKARTLNDNIVRSLFLQGKVWNLQG